MNDGADEPIDKRVARYMEYIAATARACGRNPDEITLVAISKTHPPEVIAQAIAAGITHLGENRVQEARTKIAQLAGMRRGITWHLVGQLQRNKAKVAAGLFDMVQSLDSKSLAEALHRHVASLLHEESHLLPSEFPPRPAGYRLPVLLQVNLTGEVRKAGFWLPGGLENREALSSFLETVEEILALPSLQVRGVMTIGPLVGQREAIRTTFRHLRHLRDYLAQLFPSAPWDILSMGMTDDADLAIEEGTTMLRIGRGIFGGRVDAHGI